MWKTIAGFYMLLFAFSAQAQKNKHYQSFQDVHAFSKYFALDGDSKVLISGHRGSTENGLAENSIASFEMVLAETFAFFEIDPRLTRDSIIVLMHDATLDRTTNTTGRLIDKTWSEVQSIKLKDKHGNLTKDQVPLLTDVINWAKGKTVLNLDKKDVPLKTIAELIRELDAYAHVMLTVHNADEALFFRSYHPKQMLSIHAKTPQALQAYIDAGLEMQNMIVYIGSSIKPENQALYEKLKTINIRAMISTAPSFDKEKSLPQRAEGYRLVSQDGATVIESDFPMELSRALKTGN